MKYLIFFYKIRETLIGKPLGKSTKGKANGWSSSANSQLKLRTRWWINTAISSFANSEPAHSLGPPPNGMKLFPHVEKLPDPDEDDPHAPLFCCYVNTTNSFDETSSTKKVKKNTCLLAPPHVGH